MTHTLWRAVAIAPLVVLAASPPAGAHAVGSRSDLPLPFVLFAWGAAAAVVLSFALLGVVWKTPRLRRLGTGRPAPSWMTRVGNVLTLPLRLVLLALAAAIAVAAFVGPDNAGRNLATISVFIIFWVGVQLVSATVGDVWAAFGPIRWVGVALAGFAARRGTPLPTGQADASRWPAAAVLGGFLWLELCFHRGSDPVIVGLAIAVYLIALAVGTWRRGLGWLHASEGFGVLFGLLGAMAPIGTDGDGRLRLRMPLSGLSLTTLRPEHTALVLVVLGGTTFDGLSGSELWTNNVGDSTGWTATLVRTIAMLFVIAVVTAVYVVACRAVAQVVNEHPDDIADAFAPSLVPIVLGYAVAHYFSLFLLDGQRFMALVSDPFDQGWNIFGTALWKPNLALVSPTTIAWVQVGAIVVGHIGGVVVAHDRALERYSAKVAGRSQYPMVLAMVLYSVTGLWLLQSA